MRVALISKVNARSAIGLLLVAFGLTAFGAEEIKNSSCLECHGDKSLSKTNAAGKDA